MKNIINEELNYMKYLFSYQRGKVISEQKTLPTSEKDGCEKGFYRDCATKTCVKIPKGSVIVYSQKEFDKYKKALSIAKKRNTLTYKLIKDGMVSDPGNQKISYVKYVALPERYRSVFGISHKFILYDESQINEDKVLGLVPTGRWWKYKDEYYQIGVLEYKILKPILACLENPVIQPVPITTEPVKIETINQITKVEDFPKEFILFGNYRCDGTNGLGDGAIKSTYEQQCMLLPQNLKTDQRLASWEIKFPPNVAGNPDTVPVTRWNFIWNSDGKISEIKMQNFDKIAEEEQIVYNNLLNQKTSSENLKAFMKIAYGDDTYYTNNVENFM